MLAMNLSIANLLVLGQKLIRQDFNKMVAEGGVPATVVNGCMVVQQTLLRYTMGREQSWQACGVKEYLGACQLGFLGAGICKII